MKRLLRKAALSLAVVCLSCPALAVDPNRAISQYMRERWSSLRGFTSGAVTALMQTRDGYLWIGTGKGLFRFDGSSFHPFQHATPATFSIGPVQALMVDANGTLWIILQSTQILRYSNGNFELGHDEAEFGITSVAGFKNGTVLLSSLALGPIEYRSNRYKVLTSSELPAETANEAEITADNMSSRLSSATGVAPHRFAEPDSPVTAMAQTADGKVWLGTRDKGLFTISQNRVLPSGNALPSNKINCLLALENGELWIGTDRGLAQLGPSTSAQIPPPLRRIPILAMLQDRDANVWVGTGSGLFRVNAKGIAADSGNTAVTALFEDRAGNVWLGGPHGIECLRDSAFVTYSPPGLNFEGSGAVYVDPSDRVWYAPIEGGLRWMKGKQSETVINDLLSQDVIYSIAGSNNEVWVGRQQGGLTNLRFTGQSFAATTYTERNGLAQNSLIIYLTD